MRTGRDARLLGLFAPAIVRCPPGNDLCSTVSPPVRPLCAISPVRHGVSRNIGANRSFENASAIGFCVGCSTSTGLGSFSTKQPMMFSSTSVLPTCADDIHDTISTDGSVTASITPR